MLFLDRSKIYININFFTSYIKLWITAVFENIYCALHFLSTLKKGYKWYQKPFKESTEGFILALSFFVERICTDPVEKTGKVKKTVQIYVLLLENKTNKQNQQCILQCAWVKLA